MKAEWVPEPYANFFIMKRIWPAVPCVHNVLVQVMEAQGEETWALSGVVWATSRLGRFSPDNHRIGNWVGTRVWLRHFEQKKNLLPLPGIEPWFLSYPARSLVTISTDVLRLIKKNLNIKFHDNFFNGRDTDTQWNWKKKKLIIYLLLYFDSPQTRQKPVEMYSRPYRFSSENN